MKFTKTALAVAIAGIAAAPMVATADTTLSGIIEINVNGTDEDVIDDPDTDEDESLTGNLRVGTGDVLFGIVAEQELNSGLTGYGSLRLDLDGLSNQVNDDGDKLSPTYDNVYAGIKGGFGDFRIGEIPLAVEYGQVANDLYDVGPEINGGLSYTGTFGPAGVVLNYSPEPNSDAIGVGAKFGIGGFGVGVGFEDRADSQNISAGATYTIAGAAIAAHYWTKERDVDNGGDNNEETEGFAVQAGYGFGGVSAKLTFATLESSNNNSIDENKIRLDLGYDLGGGLNASTRITAKTDDATNDNDLTEWRIQLAKSF